MDARGGVSVFRAELCSGPVDAEGQRSALPAESHPDYSLPDQTCHYRLKPLKLVCHLKKKNHQFIYEDSI